MAKQSPNDPAPSAELLDALPDPAMLVDDDIRVLYRNRAAEGWLDESGGFFLMRLGELLGCVHSEAAEAGCGTGTRCARCPIRDCVQTAILEGVPARRAARVVSDHAGAKPDRKVLVTASPIDRGDGAAALLILTDIACLLPLNEKIKVCSSCRMIKDPDAQWVHLEDFLSDRAEAEFRQSYCPDCRERLYATAPMETGADGVAGV